MAPIPLVLVPGVGLGPEAWRPTVAALGADRASTVVTLPGYGVRAEPDDDLSPTALAGRVVTELTSHEGVVLLGHSSGCQVAAHAARAAPERLAGLVLIGPTTDPAAASWPRLTGRWLATARHEDPRQVPSLARQYTRTGVPTILRAMEAARRDRIERALADVDCPVLVLRGRHDRICPQAWAAALVRRTRRGSACTLDVGAHMLPLTHGAAVADRVERFVRLVGPEDDGSRPPG